MRQLLCTKVVFLHHQSFRISQALTDDQFGCFIHVLHNDLDGPLHHSNASPLPPTFPVRHVRGKMVNFVL